jgi:hypothetical protein
LPATVTLRLGRVLVLLMASTLGDELPSIIFE